ncbi:protein of unknown function [Hyphomicrobium sp. MC1]|nr:protein of unknown function [Hyphomicrobium sp. MC1]
MGGVAGAGSGALVGDSTERGSDGGSDAFAEPAVACSSPVVGCAEGGGAAARLGGGAAESGSAAFFSGPEMEFGSGGEVIAARFL